MPDAFYIEDGDAFVSTELTRGPWDPGSQHAGPPSALIGRALERLENGREGMIARVTFEILRPIPIAPLRVEARVVRPGRSVQMIEAELAAAESGEVLIRARAWRIRTEQVDLPPVPPAPDADPPPGPEEAERKPFFITGQEVGYHTGMEVRFLEGGFLEAGAARVWMRPRVPVVAGEEVTPLQRVLVAADSGNGVSAVLDPREHLFINTDLSVHLHRMPAGDWVCLDAVTIPEAHGVGMSDTLLHDERGRIGRALQSLMVGRR